MSGGWTQYHHAQTEPPAGRFFPCASCGGNVEYQPSHGVLMCHHCGGWHRVPAGPSQVQELAFEQYFGHLHVPHEVLYWQALDFNCAACGGACVLPAHQVATVCPFCARHIASPPAPSAPMLKPQALLPFWIDYESARAIFRRWVGSRAFAPNDFLRMADHDRFHGIYIPFYTYDAMTYSFYSGKRGEDSTTWDRDRDGRRRRETSTSWSRCSGRVDNFFNDVLVCASRGIDHKRMEQLGPWDLQSLVSAEPEYLAGFWAERYQFSPRDGFEGARKLMDDEVRRLVRRDIGGDRQRVDEVRTQHEGVTFKLILLPVWIAPYRHGNRTYSVMINARTGEIIADRPFSSWKIFYVVTAVFWVPPLAFAAITFIGYLIVMVLALLAALGSAV